MDSELGRIPCIVLDCLASTLQPKERLQSKEFMRICSRICSEMSYRDSADALNMVYHRKGNDSLKLRTLSDGMRRVGEAISSEMDELTRRTLCMYGFDPDTGTLPPDVIPSESITGRRSSCVPGEQHLKRCQEAIDEINASREEAIPFTAREAHIEECPETTVYVSIDDIGVKRQKDVRGTDAVRETKYVENTVAHVQYGDKTYTMTSIGMRGLFKSLLAFLLCNSLLDHELIFLTDGARDIRGNIGEVFSFHPSRTILDWYHLKKKCQEYLSMAMRGKDRRNEAVEKVLRYLWVGDVSGAIKYLADLPEKDVKKAYWRDQLTDYFENRRSSIACYALRDKLGLRNSSNPVEKANDILVADRQKHNGMAWTPRGSGSLAAIEMIFSNRQDEAWFQNKQLSFLMPTDVRCA